MERVSDNLVLFCFAEVANARQVDNALLCRHFPRLFLIYIVHAKLVGAIIGACALSLCKNSVPLPPLLAL